MSRARRLPRALPAAALGLLILASSCQLPLQRQTRPAMSSAVNVLVYARKPLDWDALFALIEGEAVQFDWRRAEGAVGRLNRGEALVPPPEVAATLEAALRAARESGGAFDPTILPLTRLWDIDAGGRLPTGEQIERARLRVDWRRLSVDAQGRWSLPPGFALELGGIAAGAIVDKAGAYLDGLGARDYLIDSSGDILISGLKQGHLPWSVAIRNPRQRQKLVGILKLGRRGGKVAVATSGDYERFFEQDGVRYHHILDPSTGYPTRELASVTIIAPTCLEADALSTTVFVLGRERGLRLLSGWPGAEGLLLAEQDGRLRAWTTPGFPLQPGELKL